MAAYGDARKVQLAVLEYNREALDCFHAKNYEDALKLFHSAYKMLRTEPNATMQSLTLNNLSCVYSCIKVPNRALRCLEECLAVEPQDYLTTAASHLNICALKSQHGFHEEALTYGLSALGILKENFEFTRNLITMLVVAYHSVGLEYVFLGQSSKALLHFKQGMELGLEQLNRHDPLVATLMQEFHETNQEVNGSFLPSLRSQSNNGTTTPVKKALRRKTKREVRKTKSRYVKKIESRLDMMQRKLNHYEAIFEPLKKQQQEDEARRIQQLQETTRQRAASVILEHLKCWKFRRNHCATVIQRAVRAKILQN